MEEESGSLQLYSMSGHRHDLCSLETSLSLLVGA